MDFAALYVPFLRAFCLSSLSWAAAGLRVRSLDLGIFVELEGERACGDPGESYELGF